MPRMIVTHLTGLGEVGQFGVPQCVEGPTGVVPEELRRSPIRQPGQTGLGIGVGRGRGTGRGAKTCGEKHRPYGTAS